MNNPLKKPTDIDVKVQTHYLSEQSDPDKNRFVFAYTITIKNEGAVPARLMKRQWVITDADGKEHIVRGDGVVGEQPFLNPGELFKYTSGTVLPTPVGSMHGSYQMISKKGEIFEADIPAFTLADPGQLH